MGFWLVPILKVLLALDDPNVRPDDYNDYELRINIWNFLMLWTPISTDFLLCFSIIIYFMDIAADLTFRDFWEPTGNITTDVLFVSIGSAVLFIPAAIDSALSFYFYTVFKEFVETRFKNYLYACNCFFCPFTWCPCC